MKLYGNMSKGAKNTLSRVSFTGYSNMRGGTATVSDIQRMIQTYQTISNELIQVEDLKMRKALDQYSTVTNYIDQMNYRKVLQQFFEVVRNERTYYETERIQMLKLIASDSRIQRKILKDGDNYYLDVDALGDNCYEYATKNYYESVLLNQGYNQVLYQTPGITISLICKYNCPTFLQPGFTRAWPRFKDNYEVWQMNNKPKLTPSEVKQAVFEDAAAFGLSCREILYDHDTYQEKANTTLIYGIIGFYSTESGIMRDHHWYRYHPGFRVWSHKPGLTPVTCFDGNDSLIFNPERSCATYDMGVEKIGFFELSIP